jgi:hypothetical protein
MSYSVVGHEFNALESKSQCIQRKGRGNGNLYLKVLWKALK